MLMVVCWTLHRCARLRSKCDSSASPSRTESSPSRPTLVGGSLLARRVDMEAGASIVGTVVGSRTYHGTDCARALSSASAASSVTCRTVASKCSRSDCRRPQQPMLGTPTEPPPCCRPLASRRVDDRRSLGSRTRALRHSCRDRRKGARRVRIDACDAACAGRR
jgi:hypothetical protein